MTRTIEYDESIEDWKIAQLHLCMRIQPRLSPPRFLVLWPLLSLVIFASYLTNRRAPLGRWDVVAGILVLVLGAGLAAIVGPMYLRLLRWMQRRSIERLAALGAAGRLGRARIDVEEEGLRIDSTEAKLMTRWEAFTGLTRGERHHFLESAGGCVYVPLRAFVSPEDGARWANDVEARIARARGATS
jgi:hypothetical protein